MASPQTSPRPHSHPSRLAIASQLPGVPASGQALVAAVAQLARERDELARRVAILDAKLVEVTNWHHEREAVRAAYRRGYFAGRAAQRRGAPAVSDPERRARGWVREALAA
jgi:hypothetical protein